jgi:aryl-alcohol dehydrogenase-like predicted oxidoreductase/spore coat polysaccharide biosynthesis protein SpsF (cytidylyltransferase family)
MTLQVRILLQARYDSRRLPGKALLPIAGMPMFLLAARRAARTGIELTVATSTFDSDDPIVSACEAAGLSVFRGAHEDVYSRFLDATADLTDDAIVVRLTADNVFPDADLIEDLIGTLLSSKTSSYVAPVWPESGLPYGVMVEVFRIGAFRAARPQSPGDAEHVTEALARNSYNVGFQGTLALAYLRSTVDTLADYSRIRQVFESVEDPIGVGWRELCERLAKLPLSPASQMPCTYVDGVKQSQLTLGTAQFGMPYGIANATGMPSPTEIRRIVRSAIDYGVTHIDTARVYGESEARLGAVLADGWRHRVNLITKLRPVEETGGAAVRSAVDASVVQSCDALKSERLDILLLHRAATRFIAGGAVWERLLELKAKGVIGLLGISVQSPEEFEHFAADPDIDAVQLPFNLLDHRWIGLSVKRPGLLIYVRSVFLQGLLAGAPARRWPRIAGVDAGGLIATIEGLVQELGRRSMADLAIAFVRAHSWARSLVIGVETNTQLEDNLALFSTQPLDQASVAIVRRRLPVFSEMLLNPAKWPIN